ncbi:MAG TPA: hypothetical protein VGL80_07825 [Pseudonocardiaceae bacterium]|jgi:hypothetical protein
MRGRTRLTAATFATLSAAGILVGVLPITAAAAPAVNCIQNPAANGNSKAHFNGTNVNIRTGPFTSCTAVGEGQPGNKLIARCETTNSNGVDWTYRGDGEAALGVTAGRCRYGVHLGLANSDHERATAL